MNLILLERSEAGATGEVTLTGRRAAHLLRVLRVEPGQTVRVAWDPGHEHHFNAVNGRRVQ